MASITFGIVDYVLFGLALAVSAGIGIFYAIKSRRKSVDELHTGGRKLPLFPTTVSLLCSFVSGIALLSYPEEIYRWGTTFTWSLVGAWLAITVTALVIIPVLYPLKYTNLYQYLEERFGSKILRYYGDLLFIASSTVYSSVVLYTPCKALAGVTTLPLWALILIIGVVCSIYTTIGGIKAVIWTDTFQGIVMYAGVIALLVKGILAVGSDDLLELVRSGGHLAGFTNIDPNPLQYMTVWTAIFGGLFFWLSAFGASQIALQRFCSLRSETNAKVVAFLNIPGIGIVFILVFAIGLVMYAYFRIECQPVGLKRDEITMTFMLTVLHDTYGFPGLFMAAVMSGTLSTISSGINSMAAVTWCDLFEPHVPKMSKWAEKLIAQLVSAFYGFFIVAFAFLVEPLGGSVKVLFYCLGALSSPATGLFLLGLLFPWADDVGGFVGIISGSAVNLLIFISKILVKAPQGHQTLPLPTTCCGANFTLDCPELEFNATVPDYGSNPLVYFASVFSLFISCIGAVTTILIGCSVSAITRRSLAKTNPHLVFWTKGQVYEYHEEPIPMGPSDYYAYDVNNKRVSHYGFPSTQPRVWRPSK